MPRPFRQSIAPVRLAVLAITAALAAVALTVTSPPALAGEREEVTYYVVQDKGDGQPEFLFEIAERYLGDGNRYHEIFALNEGREQPDGSIVSSPEVLLPGWVLIMPDDARGEGIEVGPLPEPPPAVAPAQEATAAATADVAPGPGAGGRGGPPAWVKVIVIVIGGLLVLAVLGALVLGVVFLVRRVRRARAARPVPFDDSLLRPDTSSAWMVDRTLRVLMASCERDGIEIPQVTGVFIEGQAIRLRLRNPVAAAPEPWLVSEDGGSWSAQIGRLQSLPASTGSMERFSRLVTLGVAESGRVLIDFAQARGIISIEGPTNARHEVLRRWLGELTANPWSGDPRVVMVGDGLQQQEAVEHVAGIEQVVPELVLGHGGVLVLSRAPAAAQQELLAARFADPRFGWIVIALGQVPVARWRFTAREDGWLRSGFLPDVRFDEQTAVRRTGGR